MTGNLGCEGARGQSRRSGPEEVVMVVVVGADGVLVVVTSGMTTRSS